MLKNKFCLNTCVILAISVWFVYGCCYTFLARSGSNIAGYLALIGQSGLDVSTAILIVYLIKRTVATDTKFIYLMFLISFFSACIADGIYNLSMNIFDIKYFSSINSLFEVPFAIFLLFQATAWGSIFFKEEKKFSTSINKYSYIPYGIISALLFIMFVFGIRWKISYFSLLGAYQLMDTFLEMLGFTLATICLTRAKNLTTVAELSILNAKRLGGDG